MNDADLVYRVGRKYHWPAPVPPTYMAHHFGATACAAWPIYRLGATPAVSVDIDRRCRGKGCRERWSLWLQQTARAALIAATDKAQP